MKIFITGASGCVGHYLFDELIKDPNNQLYLLVRNPQKIKFDPKSAAIINDDLSNIEKHAELLEEMDAVVHLAADWGGNEGNYDYTFKFFSLLDPQKCKKVIYFSTASILDGDNKPLGAAEKFGTHYIRSKYRLLKQLPGLKIYPSIKVLFPTWILGGDAARPYSHASAGILDLRKWLWLIRFFTVDVSFHFIHAKDIALMTKYLLENEMKGKEWVMGNAPITAGEFIRQTCAFFKEKVYFQIPIPLSAIPFIAFLTGRKLHPWDLFCINKRHFIHKTVNAESFGIRSNLKEVRGILADQSIATSAASN